MVRVMVRGEGEGDGAGGSMSTGVGEGEGVCLCVCVPLCMPAFVLCLDNRHGPLPSSAPCLPFYPNP